MIEDPATRRTLRLALAVGIATAYGQAVNWSMNFMAAIITSGLLVNPIPAPSLRFAVSILTKIGLSLLLGLVMVLPTQHQPILGMMLAAALLFAASYATAIGRISSLDLTLIVMGLLIVPAVGASNVQISVEAAKGIAKCALVVFPAVWIAFAILPEPLFHKLPIPPPAFASRREAAIHALRPVLVIMPVFVWFFVADDTYSYAVVLLKAVIVAQQAENAHGKQLAKDMMLATIIGGAVGMVLWWTLKIWPSLIWYVILTVFSALWFGERIFGSKGGVHTKYMWGYAFTTSIALNGPAVLGSGFSDNANTAEQLYFTRLGMFLFVTFYGLVAVYLVDQWIERRRRRLRNARARQLRRRRSARDRGRLRQAT